MRRLVPWTLVLLLLAGTGAAAGLGVALEPRPSSQAEAFLSAVVRATEGAGSARLVISSVSRFRDEPDSPMHGTGVADFTTGMARLDEVRVELVSQVTTAQGGSGEPTSTKTTDVSATFRTESVADARGLFFGVGAHLHGELLLVDARAFGPLGRVLLLADTPLAPGPDPRVRRVAASDVEGTPSTEYAVGSRTGCTAPAQTTASVRLWVDRRDRLVQLQDVLRIGRGAGEITTETTLRFHDFGAPVKVTPPSSAGATVVSAPPARGSSGAPVCVYAGVWVATG